MSQSGGRQGEVFLDARGNGRAMRLTWHREADIVVLSLWRDHVCAGTFRLVSSDVNDFVEALVDGLRDAPGVHVARPEVSAGRNDPPPEAHPPVLLPRQRPPGSHAERVPSDGHQTQLSTAQPDKESFSEWAFEPEGRHRAAVN